MEDNEVKYISLSRAAEMTDYSQEYVSLLCRTKKMKGLKLGRNWVTTAKWVKEYVDRTNNKKEVAVPVKIESEKRKFGRPNNGIILKKADFINLKPHFVTLNEVTLFTLFFGLSIFAFIIFQEILILKILG